MQLLVLIELLAADLKVGFERKQLEIIIDITTRTFADCFAPVLSMLYASTLAKMSGFGHAHD